MDLIGGLVVGAGAVAGWYVWQRWLRDRPIEGDGAGATVARAGVDAAEKAGEFACVSGRAVADAVADAVRAGGEFAAKGVGVTVEAVEDVVERVTPDGDESAEAEAPAKKPAAKAEKRPARKRAATKTAAKKKAAAKRTKKPAANSSGRSGGA